MKLTRRTLLKTAAASAASALAVSRGLASGSGQLAGATAPPGGWGSFGSSRKVLEIFLCGGASFWNSFWYDETLGGATLDTEFDDWNLITGGPSPVKHNWCGGKIGPAAGPMFRIKGQRKLAEYMRVLRVRHDLEPHEVAIPFAATGTTLGRPTMSGLGAALWRRYDEVNGVPQNGPAGPKSLIFQAGSALRDIRAATSMASFGLHGSKYRPPIIVVGDRSFYDALARADRTGSDELKRFFGHRYKKHLIPAGSTTAVRSEGFSAFNAAADSLLNDYQLLRDVLGPQESLLFPAEGADLYNYMAYAESGGLYTSADLYSGANFTRNAITAAIGILTADDVFPVQHIAVVDGGVEEGYDTHAPVLPIGKIHNGNIWNVCDVLAENLTEILDNGICVLIHTEFGRKETGGTEGTEHHTDGYVSVVIGDLVKKGFAGTIDANDVSVASHAHAGQPPALQGLSPADVHAAVAQMAGIDPWKPDMYSEDLALTGGDATATWGLLGL